jgi:hypothetical protein
MPTFEIGNTVKANITAQGLTAGNTYKVTNVRSEYLPFGNFVTYIVSDGTKPLTIGNGHMLLTKVAN